MLAGKKKTGGTSSENKWEKKNENEQENLEQMYRVSCHGSFGNLPEKTGTLFNRHYPRKYVCASNNGMIGYKNNSTVS